MSRLLVALLVSLAWLAPGAAGARQPADLTFYPQAGILWQDLYVNNFVDLDPGPGVRDFACGTQTYNGHTGQDSDVRSFREMDIGVPVFAALDGHVISVQDGFSDRNYGPSSSQYDNHVVIQHGAGRFTVYGHLRRGIGVERGQRVRAGAQIGWTASSGNSTWPHLHFTSQVGGEIDEPFAGRCREGESGWTEQVPIPTEPYVRDLAVSAQPLTGRRRDLPHDRVVRAGTFRRGARGVYFRLELGLVQASASLRIRILRPDGSSALDRTRPLGFPVYHGRGYGRFSYRLALSVVGPWRLVVDVDGKTVADAPLRVVAPRARIRNRAPHGVAVALHPAEPAARGVVQCRVATSLVTEDPDYDIVRYRYRWTVGSRVVRSVTSAALSDVVRAGIAAPGQRLGCSVTPSDGRLEGPRAQVAAVLR